MPVVLINGVVGIPSSGGGGGGGTNVPTVLGLSGAAANLTGSVVRTTLATVTVPAGAMTANGQLEVWADWEMTANANQKTFWAQFGGVDVAGSYDTTSASAYGFWVRYVITNANSLTSQRTIFLGNQGGSSATFSATDSLSVNTANAQTLTLQAQLGNAADTITLRNYRVVLLNP